MGRFGASEIVIIAVFALLVFGPRRLPEMARSAGKALREFRRATAEVTDELRSIGELGSDRDTAAPVTNRPGPRPSLPPDG